MNEQALSFDDSTIQRAKHFDALCDEFETQCSAGNRPSIESFLLRVDGPDKQPLLVELIAIEMHYRRQNGESIAFAEYQTRFPGLSAARLEETIHRSEHGNSPKTPAADDATIDSQQVSYERRESKLIKYFGDYELLDVIARGGMGIVYKARQVSLNRIVALKMILSGEFASKEEVDRFYSEAKAAALLDHPGIVPIYEVGEHEGKHFFSMTYVEGSSLAAKLNDGPLEPMQAANTILEVSQAVHYAHEQGVIHRDLKPSNILLDLQGRPRVTDFGLAKRLSEDTGMTVSGQVLGTPSYMPPEQAAGQINTIGPASDVYALGAVLYSLTTGRPPFQSASSVDTLRQVVEKEPVAPRQLNPAIPRDLETIILKCLEKSLSRRYATARLLADELKRFVEGRAIIARPIGLAAKAWRWCRRQPIVAMLLGLLFFSVFFGFGFSGFFAWEERKRAVGEQNARERETKSRLSALEQRAIAERERDKARATSQELVLEKQLLLDEKEEQRRMLYTSDVNLIPSIFARDNISQVLELLKSHHPRSGQTDIRGFEWYYWNQRCNSELRKVRIPALGIFSSNGMRLYNFGNNYESVKIWDARSGSELRTLDLPERMRKTDRQNLSLYIDPNEDYLVVVSANSADGDGPVDLDKIDVLSGACTHIVSERTYKSFWDREEERIWISDNGNQLAMKILEDVNGKSQIAIGFWDTNTGAKLAAVRLPTERPSDVAISPNGSHIAMIASADPAHGLNQGTVVTIVDVDALTTSEASNASPVTIPLSERSSMRFSPDSKTLFVSTGDLDTAMIAGQQVHGAAFDVMTGKRLFSFPTNGTWELAKFSHDGKWLGVCTDSRPRSVMLFCATGDQDPVEFQGHTSEIVDIAFSKGGETLSTLDRTGQIKSWGIRAAAESKVKPLASLPGSHKSVSSSDGKLIASVRYGPEQSLVQVRDDKQNLLYKTEVLVGTIWWIKFSADSRLLAACAVPTNGDDSKLAQIRVWDSASGIERLTLRMPIRDNWAAPGAAFSPNGNQLTTISNFGTSQSGSSVIKAWDIDSRREEWESLSVPYLLEDLTYSPTGEQIVSVPNGERIDVWDRLTGRIVWRTAERSYGIPGFSSDGKQIFSQSAERGEIHFWETGNGLELRQIQVPDISWSYPNFGSRIVLSPNGRWLAVGPFNGPSPEVRVWDLEQPKHELCKLVGNSTLVLGMVFSPDSNRIATWSLDGHYSNSGRVMLWNTVTGREVLTLPGPALRVTFNSSGTEMLGEMGSIISDGIRIRRWEANPVVH